MEQHIKDDFNFPAEPIGYHDGQLVCKPMFDLHRLFSFLVGTDNVRCVGSHYSIRISLWAVNLILLPHIVSTCPLVFCRNTDVYT